MLEPLGLVTLLVLIGSTANASLQKKWRHVARCPQLIVIGSSSLRPTLTMGTTWRHGYGWMCFHEDWPPQTFWRHQWWTGLMDGGRWRWLRLEHLDADLKALADELKAPADELQT